MLAEKKVARSQTPNSCCLLKRCTARLRQKPAAAASAAVLFATGIYIFCLLQGNKSSFFDTRISNSPAHTRPFPLAHTLTHTRTHALCCLSTVKVGSASLLPGPAAPNPAPHM